MGFETLLGNERLKQNMAASLAKGRISHFYLISGPFGSGRHTLARLLAAAILCKEQGRPCLKCNSCRKVLAGSHPDFITIDDPEKKTVSVELIRQLQADAYIRPNEGQHKVYLIPRAQDMSESAQNALLKIIEEPPSYAVFLLIADHAEKLLPTVRSRCAELRLEPVPRQEALPWLAARFPEQSQDTLLAACMRSGGYLGQAEALLRGSLYLPQTLEFAGAFAKKDTLALTQTLCGMEKQPRNKVQEILAQWRQLVADAMLVRAGLPGSPEAAAIGSSRTGTDLAQAAQVLQKALDACAANVGTGHICGWLVTVLS